MADDVVSCLPVFMQFRKWTLTPVKDALYVCDIGLELEVLPSRFPVAAGSLRRWTNSQLPAVVRQVVARSIELDQVRLRAPRFLPALEASFGGKLEREGGRGRARGGMGGGPLGYLGLSELPLPFGGDSGVGRSGCKRAQLGQLPAQRVSTWTGEVVATAQAGNTAGGFGDAGRVGEVNHAAAERWFSEEDDNDLTHPGASEVHMRRFDNDSTLHRRALGAVRIEAPPELVYRVLTNFDGMPNFVPNLAFTERVALPFSLRNRPGRLRLRQVFLKCQLYHCLEAGVTLDVVQKHVKGEVQFRMLNGGAPGDTLQGKWLVVPCPDIDDITLTEEKAQEFARQRNAVSNERNGIEAGMAGVNVGTWTESGSGSGSCSWSGSGSGTQATILKFAIEGRAFRRQSSRGFWLSSGSTAAAAVRDSPLPERAVFEEILVMLHSARDHMEGVFQKERRCGRLAEWAAADEEAEYFKLRLKPQKWTPAATSPPSSASAVSSMHDGNSTRRGGVIDPMQSLRLQILKLGFGTDGLMPRRAELRSLEAYEVERAVVDAGGFEAVAERLGWTNNRRKPRGYWRDLVNVECEVLTFISENELEPGVMPSRPQFEELGRFDIARSLAKHGGSVVIAGKIGLVAPRYRPRKSVGSAGSAEAGNTFSGSVAGKGRRVEARGDGGASREERAFESEIADTMQ